MVINSIHGFGNGHQVYEPMVHVCTTRHIPVMTTNHPLMGPERLIKRSKNPARMTLINKRLHLLSLQKSTTPSYISHTQQVNC